MYTKTQLHQETHSMTANTFPPLDKGILQEMKAFTKPPQGVKELLSAMFIAFGYSERQADVSSRSSC